MEIWKLSVAAALAVITYTVGQTSQEAYRARAQGAGHESAGGSFGAALLVFILVAGLLGVFT